MRPALAERRELPCREVVAVVRWWMHERREAHEHFRIFRSAVDAGQRADRRQRNVSRRLAGERKQPDCVTGVVQIDRDDGVMNDERGRELVGGLRDDLDRRMPGFNGSMLTIRPRGA